ncbi:MAG TPA: VanZ family protein [Patescibacteria group bacterium]|nr:VanZ family protein [Patescibacteria group bacterium]
MKKFKFSLLYLLILLITSPFHVQIKNLLGGVKVFNFSNYVLLGILLAFFVLAFFRAVTSGKALDNAAILLAAAIVLYFLFQRRIFLNKIFFSNFLHIAEFFILGVLLFKENKKKSSILPFALLFFSAFTFELVQVFFHSRVVDANDIWTNVIAGLVGLVVGFF